MTEYDANPEPEYVPYTGDNLDEYTAGQEAYNAWSREDYRRREAYLGNMGRQRPDRMGFAFVIDQIDRLQHDHLGVGGPLDEDTIKRIRRMLILNATPENL